MKSITRAKCEEFKTFRANQTIPCQKCDKFKERCFRCETRDKACPGCLRKEESHDVHVATGCKPQTVESSTVNRDLITLSHILALSVTDGKLKENPMRFVPHLEEPASRERILSDEEIDRLFAALRGQKKFWSNMMIAVPTGWRRGRILGLEKNISKRRRNRSG